MTNSVRIALQRLATNWAGQLTSLAKSYAPKHIQDAISSKTEENGGGTFIIRIIADRRIAKDARAWEYGSGLKARRGEKKKYDIHGKPWLAFIGTNGYGNAFGIYNPITHQGSGDRNIVITPIVHHPGIMAANNGQGYIAPAIKELRAKGKAQLIPEIKQAILDDIRKSFGRKA